MTLSESGSRTARIKGETMPAKEEETIEAHEGNLVVPS